jgi:hypothetical protein
MIEGLTLVNPPSLPLPTAFAKIGSSSPVYRRDISYRIRGKTPSSRHENDTLE